MKKIFIAAALLVGATTAALGENVWLKMGSTVVNAAHVAQLVCVDSGGWRLRAFSVQSATSQIGQTAPFANQAACETARDNFADTYRDHVSGDRTVTLGP